MMKNCFDSPEKILLFIIIFVVVVVLSL